jgi:hypothetical protein
MRMLLMAGAGAAALTLAGCNTSGQDTAGATTSGGGGLGSLINVDLSHIRAEIARNANIALERVPITIQLPVTVAANVCGVNVNILTVQVDTGGQNSCTATATSPALEQEVVNTIS